ncbi:MAG: hypothetical protein R6W72_03945 [Desulfurivibrionaceae bacterium]
MKDRYIVFFVASAFFLSGGCGLVYEVLWTRYLADLMGATSLSHLVVLMVFMGGLALGAMLIGRLVDRGRNGLLYFGCLEVGIGLYAVIFPFLFSQVSSLFISVGSSFEPGSSSLLTLKLFTASLVIAAPAVAMGGTLPAVTRYLTGSREYLRRNISLLYGVNSLGATIGILIGGFFLVYKYGMTHSMIYTGIVNICLGLVALGVAHFLDRGKVVFSGAVEVPTRRPDEEELDGRQYKPYAIRRAIIGAALSGFAAMALQVAWLRYFGIVLGATHSVFTIVVAAFVCGIGLGALLIRSHWIGRMPLPTVLTFVFALTAATIGLGLFGYGRLPFEINRFLAIFDHTSSAWPFYLILKFGLCFMLMLLPTVASGMILPLCVRIAGGGGERVGRDVGMVYGVNTLGALLGIGVTSQILFRTLTLPRTIQFILMIYLATTFFLAFVLEEKGRKRILAITVIMLAAHLSFWQPWSPVQLHVGRINFGGDQPITYSDFFKEINEQQIVVEERQGPDVQVTVVDVFYAARKLFRSMYINGKPDASNKMTTDFATEVLLGQLPMLLHPAPRNAFVLGLGSGITSGEILKFPELEKLTTVELAAEVFEASKNFAADNGRFWENRKHRMVIDDGKTFLRLSKEKFDVISMEPTNVWQEGMAGLFSEEFFRLVKSRLATGGVVTQWLHAYELDDYSFNIILKTFSRVFPSASIFKVWHGDFLLVGYDEQWRFDPENLERRFYQPQILETEKKIDIVNPSALLLREIMDRDQFNEYTTVVKAPVNTENFPVLEKVAEYGLFLGETVSIFAGYDSRIEPDGEGLLIHDYFNKVGFDPEQLKAAVDLMKPEPANKDKLRNSLYLMFVNKLWPGTAGPTPQEISQYFEDSQLRETIRHYQKILAYYHRLPDAMTVEETYELIVAELGLWTNAASQLWTPQPERLMESYSRLTSGLNRENAVRVALDIAVVLAEGGACKAAMPFFRIAEEKGGMSPEGMEPIDIVTLFRCEAKEGDARKALTWWKYMAENNIAVTEYLLADKTALDIKLGGDPPPPVYGRLPD